MKKTKVLTKKIDINGATYTITSEGRVYGAYGQLIKTRLDSCGYLCITAGRKGRRTRVRVHRLVAEAFLPNPHGYSDVDHLDSDRTNPRLENLEWVPHRVNVQRAYARGHHKGRVTGIRNPKARLTELTVLKLRALYKAGVPIYIICEIYHLPWNTVGNAVKGITWSHLPL